ncbi:aminoglycoside phosphotransferase [Mycolicibacterium rhodesiae JS60]|nr:aminoglycoside phosphotransferase [Mycolicibacterium rhodesiae JS60]
MTVSIPRGEKDLDDAWISDVFGSPVRITAMEGVGVGAAFACQLYRLFLDGPDSVPGSVVVKLPVEGEIRAVVDGIGAYGREVVFYREISGQLPVRTPRAYAAAQATDNTDFVLVIEDLTDCEPVDQVDGLTMPQAEAAVDALARLHAWSWGRTDLLDGYADQFWPIDSEPGTALQKQYGALFAHVWTARRDAFSELLGPAAQRVGDHFAQLQPELVAQLAAPRCLTHGELRADNMFVDGSGEPVFFDFQAAQQECGVRELQYLIGTSLPEDTLARVEDVLLERYVAGLHDAGVDYAVAAAREQYWAATTYNLMWPVMACVRWDAASDRGRATLETMTRRLGAAIERQA